MFGINGGELLVLLLVAAVVIGPERLPRYAEQLARWVRTWRATLTTTKERIAAELGDDDVDWAALDPRRYDPRRIVRDALTDVDGTGPGPGGAAGPGPVARTAQGAVVGRGAGSAAGSAARPDGSPPPFDDEAT